MNNLDLPELPAIRPGVNVTFELNILAHGRPYKTRLAATVLAVHGKAITVRYYLPGPNGGNFIRVFMVNELQAA